MINRIRSTREAVLLLCAFGLVTGALSGCAGLGGIANARTPIAIDATPTYAPPTPTNVPPTPTNVPPGWQVYVGPHFTIAYPPDWSLTADSAAPNGAMGRSYVFQDAARTVSVEVSETYGYSASNLQDLCKPAGTTVVVAGIPMHYTVAGGMYRTWYFINSHKYEYGLIAIDGLLSRDIQAADDAILATFRPDDPKSGCPA